MVLRFIKPAVWLNAEREPSDVKYLKGASALIGSGPIVPTDRE